MPGNIGNLRKSASLIGGKIEEQLEKVVQDRKEKIKMELAERVRQNKIEVEKKVDLINKELEKGKKFLNSYRAIIDEHQINKAKFEDKINTHIEQVLRYQNEIKKLADFSLAELIKGRELSEKFGKLLRAKEERILLLMKKLERKIGIAFKMPELKAAESKLRIDFEQEMNKMRKIREILGMIGDGSSEDFKQEKKREEKKQEIEKHGLEEATDVFAPGEGGVSAKKSLPEQEGKEDRKKLRRDGIELRSFSEKDSSSETKPIVKNGQQPKDPLIILNNYRQSEITEERGKISYFQNNGKIIFDGISIISGIERGLDKVKKLYQELYQTDSPRDQFYLKQDIINNQEMLKHLIRGYIKKYKQESCYFPEYTSDIVNIQTLQEILEKLYTQNWSNQDEFKDFDDHFKSISKAFHDKINPVDTYVKSILQTMMS